MSGSPSHLSFDEAPSSAQLAVLLGAPSAAARVDWREDDERIELVTRRLPLGQALALLFSFAAALTTAPLWLPRFGYELPEQVRPELLWTIAAAVWAFVAVGGARDPNDRGRAAGPGALVDKRSGELSLPWLGVVVPRDRLARFVQLKGRARRGRGVEPVYQSCALFRDADGRYVCAPFARLFARPRGRCPAQRLADYYDLPMEELDAGLL